MAQLERSIFRESALRHYLQDRQAAVLPRLVSPRAFLFSWVVLLLLLAAGTLAWLAQVPAFAPGTAVIAQEPGSATGLIAVTVLPPEMLPRVSEGQRLILQLENGRQQFLEITAVVPAVQSPQQVAVQWPVAKTAVHQPVTVALAEFNPSVFPSSTYIGSRFPARVEVGMRRVISLLPVIGCFFQTGTEAGRSSC